MKVIDLRKRFETKIGEKMESQSQNKCEFSKAQLQEIIDRLKLLREAGTKKYPKDYRTVKKFQLREYNVNGEIVEN